MDEHPGLPSSTFFSGKHPQSLAQLSDEDFWRYAREMAHLFPSVPAAHEYLKCTLAENSCVLPLAALREVVPLPRHFTWLPSSPAWMLGLTSWCDAPIAVLDLSAYFSRSRAQLNPDASLLIAQNDYVTLGFSVVVLSSIPSLQTAAVQPLKPSSAKYTSLPSGIIGLYEDAFVLDIPSLLTAMMQDITMAKAYE